MEPITLTYINGDSINIDDETNENKLINYETFIHDSMQLYKRSVKLGISPIVLNNENIDNYSNYYKVVQKRLDYIKLENKKKRDEEREIIAKQQRKIRQQKKKDDEMELYNRKRDYEMFMSEHNAVEYNINKQILDIKNSDNLTQGEAKLQISKLEDERKRFITLKQSVCIHHTESQRGDCVFCGFKGEGYW